MFWLNIENVDQNLALFSAEKPSFDAYLIAEKPPMAFPGGYTVPIAAEIQSKVRYRL